MSKRWQGRVGEACVKSSLFNDCQARMGAQKDA